MHEAREATRRIAICGFFIESIVGELPHGQLGPWIDAHESIIGASRRSIFGWRQFATNILEAIGLQKCNALHFSVPLHEALALPASAKLPADVLSARQKIDELIEGKSYRQLSFEFQTSDDAPAGSYDRATRGKGKTGITVQPLDKQAEVLFLPAADEFVRRCREGLWRHLPRQILTRLDGDLLDIRAELKKHLYG